MSRTFHTESKTFLPFAHWNRNPVKSTIRESVSRRPISSHVEFFSRRIVISLYKVLSAPLHRGIARTLATRPSLNHRIYSSWSEFAEARMRDKCVYKWTSVRATFTQGPNYLPRQTSRKCPCESVSSLFARRHTTFFFPSHLEEILLEEDFFSLSKKRRTIARSPRRRAPEDGPPPSGSSPRPPYARGTTWYSRASTHVRIRSFRGCVRPAG